MSKLKLLEEENAKLKEECKVYKKNCLKLSESENDIKKNYNRQRKQLETLERENSSITKELEKKNREISSLIELLVKNKVKSKKYDIEEETRKLTEDRAATDQQIRAYKRQVDELRQQMDKDREKFEESRRSLEAKVHEMSSREKSLNAESYCKEQRLQEELSRCRQENDRLRTFMHITTERRYPQQRPQTSEQLDGRCEQILPQYHTYPSADRKFYPQEPVNDRLEECTQRADKELRELEEMTREMEMKRGGDTRNLLPAPQYGTEQHIQESQTAREYYQHYEEDEDNSIPYDPNLVCQRCGQKYRFGEIQKLRRHVNEFCRYKQL